MSSLRQRNFLLRKPLDAIAHDIDAALVAGVELEYGFFVTVAKELAREAEDGGGLADARHAGDDDVGHVAIFGDDFEAFDGFFVADYVGEVDGAVFFDPINALGLRRTAYWRSCYQGRSKAAPCVSALRPLAALEDSAFAITIPVPISWLTADDAMVCKIP